MYSKKSERLFNRRKGLGFEAEEILFVSEVGLKS